VTLPATASTDRLPPPREAVHAAAAELSRAVGGRLSFEEQDRLCYARDMWPKALVLIRQGRIPPPPDAVVWPATEDEVAQVIRTARAHRIPLIPFGAGSGVCGGVCAVKGGIAIDLKKLERVEKVDRERLAVEAQAGVMGEVLERALNGQGFTLGHFPSSIYMSTLGGWLATRSAGQFSSWYGKIEDMVLSVRAVFGTGEVVATPTRPRRGPDLAQLLIGSEGTLCAFTGATLRVHPVPEHRAFRGIRFRTVAEGVEAIRQIFRAGLRPAVVRLYDPFDTALVGRSKRHEDGPLPPSLRGALESDLLPTISRHLAPRTLGRPWLLNRAAHLLRQCLLVLVFEGEARRTAREEAAARAVWLRAGGEDLGEEPGRNWFAKRYAVSYKMSKVFDAGAFVDTMEVAATWDRVLDIYDRVRAAVGRLAFVLCHFSHAYPEGCSLYFTFVSSAAPEEEERRYDELWRVALQAAMSAGATVSHHHGIGLLKSRELRAELGEGRRMLSALKRAFDPEGIMNPGKLTL
jgi:alkyldihydroxyacetonephosphate synthase